MFSIYSKSGYFITNEGTAKKPSYHVWISGVTHAVCDSAYLHFDLAICRCDFLEKTNASSFYVRIRS
jgi:hypothetical protein